MTTKRPWTTTEVATLRHLLALGMSQARIGARLSRTVGSVRHQITTSRMSDRVCIKWTEIEDARLKRLLRDGISVRQIEREIGRSERAIRNRMCALGVTVKGERAMVNGVMELAA